jgi:hypothetical protein
VLEEILRVRSELLALDGGDNDVLDVTPADLARNRQHFAAQRDLKARQEAWRKRQEQREDSDPYPTAVRTVEIEPTTQRPRKRIPMFDGEVV